MNIVKEQLANKQFSFLYKYRVKQKLTIKVAKEEPLKYIDNESHIINCIISSKDKIRNCILKNDSYKNKRRR